MVGGLRSKQTGSQDSATWPSHLLQLLPDDIAKLLKGTSFNSKPTLHPEDDRAVFRSVEELVLHHPETIDISKKTFGKIEVRSFSRLQESGVGEKKVHYDRWMGKCECGKEKEFGGNNLRTGNSKSCGCARAHYKRLNREQARNN